MTESREKIEGIVILPEHPEQILNHRQLEDDRQHLEHVIKWIDNLGKDPDKAQDYACDTARQRCYKNDRVVRRTVIASAALFEQIAKARNLMRSSFKSRLCINRNPSESAPALEYSARCSFF